MCVCSALRVTPPRPRDLSSAVNTCLSCRGVPPLSREEEAAYAAFYATHAAPADVIDSVDSFVSDVSSDLCHLSLGQHSDGAGTVEGDFFPFGPHVSLDSAARAAIGEYTHDDLLPLYV